MIWTTCETVLQLATYATATWKLVLGEQFLGQLEVVDEHQDEGGAQEYSAPLPEPKVLLAKDDRGGSPWIVHEDVKRPQEWDRGRSRGQAPRPPVVVQAK